MRRVFRIALRAIAGVIALGVALASRPVAAQEAFVIKGAGVPKPLFVGRWTIAGRDVTCGVWPRNLDITEANSRYIVADGQEYDVTSLPGHPPHDRENIVITQNVEFQIYGDEQRRLMISFKTGDNVTGQCGYVRTTPPK